MLKLEISANRAKCLSFHPERTWLLASFFTGEIIIYDYEAGVALQVYNDHVSNDGDKGTPVRAVDFHPSQPFFCSGADDTSVRVFNYETQRCFAMFKEHMDYVRTVQFHPVHPFIVSAADDMTVRIWNWETRTSVSVIQGHNHYVMSAFFHPTKPWILSASLDDSIRVWDVSSLFNELQPSGIFSLTETVIKYQQEEHSAGVNYASWHPSRPLAVSCSDDQTAKIWKIDDSSMHVISTFRSHSGNVSAAIFHPTVDVVITASEDHTVRIWDSVRYTHLMKYQRPDDRFWCVAAHSSLPLFAAGHDSGLIVFRLLRQRPTYYVNEHEIIFYKETCIRKYNADSQTDTVVGYTKPQSAGAFRSSPLDSPPSSFSYNSSQKILLVGFQNCFELHSLNGSGTSLIRTENGRNPVWIGRSQYAYLHQTNSTQLCVREVNGSTVTEMPIPETIRIFSASPSNVYLATPSSIILYDVVRRREVSMRSIGGIKMAIISPDRRRVAFIASSSVTISSIDLSRASTFHDGSKIKSGVWHENFFIYTTKTHVKYFLPKGDSGIMRSINFKAYLAVVLDKHLICITNTNDIRRLDVDLTECRFKAALEEGNLPKVTSILKSAKLCSESIIDYLINRGHPEIALVFVEDPLVRFRLGLSSGDLQVAVEAAIKLNDPVIWESLADEAMLHGRFSVAELALQKSGNAERLAFFYLISGQSDKMKSIDCDDQPALKLQRAIWINDRDTISEVLKDTAPPLSTIAIRDKLEEIPENLKEVCQQLGKPELGDYSISTGSSEDWPLLFVSKPSFDIVTRANELENEEIGEGWNDDIDDIDMGQSTQLETTKNGWDEDDIDIEENNQQDGWGFDDDLGEIDDQFRKEAAENVYLPPTPGLSQHDTWTESTDVPGEVAAAGFFGQALELLRDQIALVEAEPLKNAFLSCYVASNASMGSLASLPSISIPLGMKFADRASVPMIPSFIDMMKSKLNNGYVEFTKGNFTASQKNFLLVLQLLPLTVCNTVDESNEVNTILSTCRNYLTALMIVNEMDTQEQMPRKLELAAYFTHCELQPKHMILTLKKAFLIAAKEQNYNLVVTFGTRLSSLSQLTDAYQKKIAIAQQQAAKSKPQKINYDPRNPFDIDCGSLAPIYRGSQKCTCPFCRACYTPSYSGQTCKVCQLSKIGQNSSGLKLIRPKHK